MNFIKRYFFTALLFCFVSVSLGQQIKCHDISSLVKTLNENHILPQEINQEFSEKVIDLYIEKLDPYQYFFLKEDVLQIKGLKTSLHKNLEINACKLTKLSKELYLKRLTQLDSVFIEIGKNPFDTQSAEVVNYTTTPDFSEDVKPLGDEWKKWLHLNLKITN